uniref:Uncharacterized protein n=1 Tax=uncultured Armatimonadetes bacterium TaxID=157466 RepID=A0A6J4IWQ6_9BACT|nr:hypothetical protein AVDCRST_MAG63-2439 [uncultured Armatimonadetes bacterium]
MKLHVHFEAGGMKVDEVVAGQSAEEVVASMQKRVAAELGFLKGAFVRAMTPLAFAQEVTRRYNSAMKESAPIPQTCEQFIDYGIDKNFATLVEDGGR